MAFLDLAEGILEEFSGAQGFAPLETTRDLNAMRMNSFSIHDPRRASKKQRMMRQLRGRCTRCSARTLSQVCPTCAAKNLERVKAIQAAHSAAGRCTCGRPRDLDGRKCCSECIRKSKAYQKQFGRKPKPAGICRRCKDPVVEGKSCCKSCLAKGAAYMAKKRAQA